MLGECRAKKGNLLLGSSIENTVPISDSPSWHWTPVSSSYAVPSRGDDGGAEDVKKKEELPKDTDLGRRRQLEVCKLLWKLKMLLARN